MASKALAMTASAVIVALAVIYILSQTSLGAKLLATKGSAPSG